MKTHNPALHSIAGTLRSSCVPRAQANVSKIESGPCRNALKIFKRAVRFEVPLGYQDETGFHYGEEPRSATIPYCGDI